MIPKIIFRYSSIYDELFKSNLEKYYEVSKSEHTKKVLEDYPSRKRIGNYVKKIEPLWKEKEKKVLEAISKISGLKWQEIFIKVYIVGKCRPFSDPLTICPHKKNYEFIDVLTHELIHQIQTQNSKIFKKWLDHMKKKYGKESRITKSHIFLHAVHKKIYLEIFDKKRLNKNLKRSIRPEYARAWQIVEEEGYENIIKKFREVIK